MPYKPSPPPLIQGAGAIHYDRELRALSQSLDEVEGQITSALALLLPRGIITMWSGAINAIPDGWLLCDGTNGTPDLRNRFVIGAGGAFAVAATGGANSVTLAEANLPAHSHGVGSLAIASGGGHSHTFSGTTSTNGDHTHNAGSRSSGTLSGGTDGTRFSRGFQNQTTDADSAAFIRNSGSHNHTFSGTTSTDGAHSHTLSGSTGSIGSGTAFSILNPYFALAYIMKA